MTGSEIAAQVEAKRTTAHCGVKSWGKNHKLVDYDLIDRFLERIKGDDSIEGFELLTLEELWQALVYLDPDNLTRVKTAGGEIISWVWTDRSGKAIKTDFPFSPEGIMAIMNDEFFS